MLFSILLLKRVPHAVNQITHLLKFFVIIYDFQKSCSVLLHSNYSSNNYVLARST